LGPLTPRARRERGLRLGHKVVIAVGVLVPAVVTIASAALYGLSEVHHTSRHLYEDTLVATAAAARLDNALAVVAERSVEAAASTDPAQVAALATELDQVWVPRANDALDALAELSEAEDEGRASVDEIRTAFAEYDALRRTGAYLSTGQDPESLRIQNEAVRRTSDLFERMHRGTERRLAIEREHAAESVTANESVVRFTRGLIVVTVVTAMLLASGGILWLIRTLVPRIRHYSAFAADVAADSAAELLRPKGRDELAELGRALDEMVEQRQRLSSFEERQAEFLDTLQISESEDEAHDVLRRHLERSVRGSEVILLKRNNSANRLEPVTGVAVDGALARRLVAAQPRSCLALRFARTHREGDGRESLMNCDVCAECAGSLCEPLVVGGQVIGSVLMTRHERLDGDDAARVKSTVAQAAPMLANLRNLALAEFRANNDSLTGLPNKRAAEDTLKRMVAQASRSVSPLAVMLLDLDYFKQINDRYGHSKGDEVLAAVGTCLQSALRANDFAGRFGGEEFLVLLPDTGRVSAVVVAEKVRHAIASIVVPELDRDVTASLGIAVLPDHAGHAEGLLREADHALYTAKATGRNRVAVAGETPGADVPERVADSRFATAEATDSA
jgi:diguanylate cyclase (GGDEF)-like protein